jgi:membrane protease YdiL (CAAX protease family)
LLRVDPRLAAAPAARSLLDKLVLSLGAGVWEELVFRLLALGGLAWLFDRALKLRSWIAIVLAFALSSVLFAAAHHAGPHGEPFRLGAMVYRTCAGLVFATLYQLRGFAIAVYTHTLYDVYVLVLH